MAAKQGDVLRPYVPGAYPEIEGGESQYLTSELSKAQRSIALLIQVVKQFEVRLIAGGL